jgi:hypothetical protein
MLFYVSDGSFRSLLTGSMMLSITSMRVSMRDYMHQFSVTLSLISPLPPRDFA